MSFRALARYKCDGCKVIESEEIEVPADIMQADTPNGWLRVEMMSRHRDLDHREIKHFCTSCSRSISHFLQGRTLADGEQMWPPKGELHP